MIHIKKNKLNVFKFAISYISIFLIIFIIFSFIYNSFINILQEETSNSTLKMLEHSIDILDRTFMDVDNYANALLNDNKIKSFSYLKEPYANKNTFKIIDIKKHIKNYRYTNAFILDMYVYFKRSDILFLKDYVLNMPKDYKNNYFKLEGISYNEWLENTFNKFYVGDIIPYNIFIKNKLNEVIQCGYSIGYNFENNGLIAFLLDKNKVIDLFSGIDTSNGGWFYVEDSNGNVIFSSIDKKKTNQYKQQISKVDQIYIENNKFLINKMNSKYNGLIYITVQPSKNITRKPEYIRKIAIITSIIYFIIGIFISYILAYFNSKPLTELINLIKNKQNRKDFNGNYETIKHTFIDLYDNNKKLKNSVDMQRPYIRKIFFEHLIDNKYKFNEEVKSIAKCAEINMDYNYFVVSILNFSLEVSKLEQEDIDNLNVKRCLLKQFISKYNNTSVIYILYEAYFDKIIFIHGYDFEDKMTCICSTNEFFNKLLSDIRDKLNLNLSVSISDIHSSYYHISKAFMEAVQTLNKNMLNKNDSIVLYEDLEKRLKIYYYYPLEIEVKLMNYVRSGDFDKAIKLVDNIFYQNINKNNVSAQITRLFIYDVASSVIKLIQEFELENDEIDKFIEKINKYDKYSIIENKDTIICELKLMCNIINNKKRSHNKDLVNEIKDYINLNYTDANLSLNSIGDRFNISQVYLSKLFKEQSGINFYEYLENLRINQSQKLLKNTDLTVKSIANEVGYNSVNTFGKAFKRNVGVSCSEYRMMKK